MGNALASGGQCQCYERKKALGYSSVVEYLLNLCRANFDPQNKIFKNAKTLMAVEMSQI